jgi:hypothetical protein
VKKCTRGFLTFISPELSSALPVLPLLKSRDQQAATLFEIPYKNAWANELSVRCQKATNALFHDYLFYYYYYLISLNYIIPEHKAVYAAANI